mgnify:CR=1 FL=1
MAERRNKVQIITDILEVVNSRGKIKTTHILYKSNLSHQKLKQLLQELTEREMITEEKERGTRYYKIAENGLKFLTEYKKLRKFPDSFGF